MEKYKVFIFTDKEKGELSEKISLLKKEAELVRNYSVVTLDIDSTEAFKPKIMYHCARSGLVAITDAYNRFVVRINTVPWSFFHLRKILLDLGYVSAAKSIQWETDEFKKD
jgi:hypothetical protein